MPDAICKLFTTTNILNDTTTFRTSNIHKFCHHLLSVDFVL